MNDDRGRDPRFSALKAAWRRVVDDLGGGAAMTRDRVTRIGPSLISRYGLMHESCFTPIDVALESELALVIAGEEPHLLKAYADALGFDIAPKAAGETANTLTRQLGRVARASGELVSCVADAVDDGIVSQKEGAHLKERAREVRELAAGIEEIAERAVANVMPIRRGA
jgi:hypothetical protein